MFFLLDLPHSEKGGTEKKIKTFFLACATGYGNFQKKKIEYLGWLIRQINTMTYLGLFKWKSESYRMCHSKQINGTFEWMHSRRNNLSEYTGAIFI